MENTEKEYIYIHSLKLADRLVNEGFRCRGKKLNVQNPKFYDFLFDKTPEVVQVVEQYTKEKYNQ